MKRTSNALTIIRKEFARFFGDRQLLFTTVIMPGLLIYIIYSIMGSGIGKITSEGQDAQVNVYVENMPASLAPMLMSMDTNMILEPFNAGVRQMVGRVEDKDNNIVLVCFPEDFDEMVQSYTPQSGVKAPNVEVYYNSANNASMRVYAEVTALLTAYEDGMSNLFDVNRMDDPAQAYDRADIDDVLGDVWSKLLPMLIIMMLFSGVMAIAPSAIAGEKERGTIATLLVTPMNRSELALGKIVSLSAIALLSGISSFIGIALSLPKMIQPGTDGLGLSFNYTFNDYAVLLLTILASVLIMASAVSLLSAYAKDVKNAGTMVTPFMLVVMLAGLLPMFQNGASDSLWIYLIPFYNSIEVMVAVFAHSVNWAAVAVMLASNAVYTAIAIWGLTRMFNSEKVMFGR